MNRYVKKELVKIKVFLENTLRLDGLQDNFSHLISSELSSKLSSRNEICEN